MHEKWGKATSAALQTVFSNTLGARSAGWHIPFAQGPRRHLLGLECAQQLKQRRAQDEEHHQA